MTWTATSCSQPKSKWNAPSPTPNSTGCWKEAIRMGSIWGGSLTNSTETCVGTRWRVLSRMHRSGRAFPPLTRLSSRTSSDKYRNLLLWTCRLKTGAVRCKQSSWSRVPKLLFMIKRLWSSLTSRWKNWSMRSGKKIITRLHKSQERIHRYYWSRRKRAKVPRRWAVSKRGKPCSQSLWGLKVRCPDSRYFRKRIPLCLLPCRLKKVRKKKRRRKIISIPGFSL